MRLSLTIVNPDEYLCGLLAEFPDEVAATVIRLAAEKRRPPLTTGDLINALSKAGVAAFAERLRQRVEAVRSETQQHREDQATGGNPAPVKRRT